MEGFKEENCSRDKDQIKDDLRELDPYRPMGPKEMLLKVLRELADIQFKLENSRLVGLPLVPGTS